jgi:hypothetical protein
MGKQAKIRIVILFAARSTSYFLNLAREQKSLATPVRLSFSRKTYEMKNQYQRFQFSKKKNFPLKKVVLGDRIGGDISLLFSDKLFFIEPGVFRITFCNSKHWMSTSWRERVEAKSSF